MKFRRLLVVAIAVAVVMASTSPGLPSQEEWYGAQSASGMVTIGFTRLYAVQWDLKFRPIHEVEAFDVVRRELLRQGRIRDLPILIHEPSDQATSWISLEHACEIPYIKLAGPSSDSKGVRIEDCYSIGISATQSFEDKLAMIVALSELSPRLPRIAVEDPVAFRSARAAKIQAYRKLVLHFDPTWSPDGARLLYTAWESGKARFEFRETSSSTLTRLEPLDGYMATRPIWSDDSRFIAYAALQMVKVFDTQTRTTKTFRPKERSGSLRTLIQFEGARLLFAFDVNVGGGYEVYALDTVTQKLESLPAWPSQPQVAGHERANELLLDRHASLRPVRSPPGRHIALFTFVDGQRRIELKTLR